MQAVLNRSRHGRLRCGSARYRRLFAPANLRQLSPHRRRRFRTDAVRGCALGDADAETDPRHAIRVPGPDRAQSDAHVPQAESGQGSWYWTCTTRRNICALQLLRERVSGATVVVALGGRCCRAAGRCVHRRDVARARHGAIDLQPPVETRREGRVSSPRVVVCTHRLRRPGVPRRTRRLDEPLETSSSTRRSRPSASRYPATPRGACSTCVTSGGANRSRAAGWCRSAASARRHRLPRRRCRLGIPDWARRIVAPFEADDGVGQGVAVHGTPTLGKAGRGSVGCSTWSYQFAGITRFGLDEPRSSAAAVAGWNPPSELSRGRSRWPALRMLARAARTGQRCCR